MYLNKDFIKTIILSILIVIPVVAFSQNDSLNTNKVLTLQEIIAAIDKNPSLLAFDEKIQSYGAYAKGARSLDAPKITGGLWMTPYSFNPNMGGSVMVGAEQMIMNPAKRKAEQNYMAGMANVEQTMKSFERQDIIEMAKKSYYEWLILKKKLEVLEKSEELIKLMIKSGEINYTYNQGMLARVYKGKSQLYDLQNMKIMTQNDIRQKNIELNTFMNIDKNITYNIDTAYTIADYDKILIDTAAIAKNRSDLQGIEESIKLYGLRKTFELSKRKPDFGVQYAHMNGLGVMPNQFTLMGMVTIPIAPWSAKGYKANLEGLKFETSTLSLRKQAILNETLGNLHKIRTEIANRKKQVEMYEKNIIPALEKNYTTSLIAFEHMKEDMFMTIDAWMALLMAKIEHLNLLGELLKMQAEYERQIEK